MADKVELSIDIDADADTVWAALTDPTLIKRYMMGADVATDWQVGHPITWSGNYQGKAYEDKGVVQVVEPARRLSVTHWSPLSRLEDKPENYHTVTYDLVPAGVRTKLTLTQENLTGVSPEQSARNWQPMLDGLKATAEAE